MRNWFLGSLIPECGVCAIRALVVTAALIGPAVLPAGAQEKVDPALEVVPASRIPASPMLAARSSVSPQVLMEAPAFTERSLNFSASRCGSALAASCAAKSGSLSHADTRDRLLRAFSMDRQRTPFQSQVRLPIREFFGGRLELACVHSKARHVSVHSAVPRSAMGHKLNSPYAASLAPRTRASLALGLWFRFSGS